MNTTNTLETEFTDWKQEAQCLTRFFYNLMLDIEKGIQEHHPGSSVGRFVVRDILMHSKHGKANKYGFECEGKWFYATETGCCDGVLYWNEHNKRHEVGAKNERLYIQWWSPKGRHNPEQFSDDISKGLEETRNEEQQKVKPNKNIKQ